MKSKIMLLFNHCNVISKVLIVIIEPVHEISKNVVCATSKASD